MISFLRFLDSRFGRLLRYGVVGVGLALLYSLLTVLFHESRFLPDPTEASMLAFLLTAPVSFFAHSRITYADADRDHTQWRRFGISLLSGFVISVGAMKSVDLLGKPYWIALVIGWFLVPAVNYVVNAIWVFRVKNILALEQAAQDKR
jgi:putative flippase GtrA